ncbi:MAG: YdbL family protein [Shewanella sp.]|uniref:YdbL family protein n=1 Tax=Shewanella sp. SNU WT4 TaxID=2590015 RepID=UPI001129D741|nr:YdbL family protein [Shewanella sp. SNU WT4]QDF67369.1 DUF1318 domain-containing protein [Shewanella sp. SNU WT4]
MKTMCSALLALMMSFSVWAMDLTEAKSEGFLGEQRNGYLGVVNANAAAEAIMQQVNAKRLAAFSKIASQNGISVDDVAALAAQKAIASAPAGTYVQTSSGQWLKK